MPRGDMERQRREFEAEGRRWRAVEAWRSSSGSVLVHFLPLDGGGEPAADDRLDRRAGLATGRRLDELADDELAERLAEGGVAEGLTGVLFSALEGEPQRARGPGDHVGEASGERLAAWWRAAVEPGDGEGEAAGDGDVAPGAG